MLLASVAPVEGVGLSNAIGALRERLEKLENLSTRSVEERLRNYQTLAAETSGLLRYSFDLGQSRRWSTVDGTTS